MGGSCLVSIAYCNWQQSHPGLALMGIHTDDTAINIRSFRFNGPNTYSNAVDVFCQYGGMWLYSSSERTFTNPTLILEQCTMSNEMFSGMLYTRSKHFAVAVVQYPGINNCMIRYYTMPISKHHSAQNFDVSPVYPDQTIVLEQQFHILQTYIRLENLKNVSVYLTDSPYINDIKVVDIIFRHTTQEESCTCEAIISHIHVHDEQKWCTTSQEHNIQRQMLSSVAYEDGITYKITRILKPKHMHLNCKECIASGFILFQLEQIKLSKYIEVINQTMVTLVQPGYFFKYSTLDYQSIKLWIHIKSAENFKVRIFPDDSKKTSSLSSNVTFLECVNDKMFVIETTLYSRSSLQLLTQGCTNACLIAIAANGNCSNSCSDQSLNLLIHLLPLQNDTSHHAKMYVIEAHEGVQR